MQKQTQVQQDSFISSQRPWIVSEFVPITLVFKEDGVFLNMQIQLSNTGHSLAQSVAVRTELYFDERTVVAERDKYCDRTDKNKIALDGYALFSGQAVTTKQWALGHKEHLSEALATGLFKNMKMVTIYAITCVDYRSSIEDKLHQTGIIYFLSRPDPRTNAKMIIFDPKGTWTPPQFSMNRGKSCAD